MFRKERRLFAFLIGGITTITTIYAFFQIFKKDNPIIGVTVNRAELLTPHNPADQLQPTYTINKRKIDNLWKCEISLVNEGQATLIGVGDKKTLIGDSISLRVLSPARFVTGHVETDAGSARYWLSDDTTVTIKFIQWRPGQYFKIVGYLEEQPTMNGEPIFTFDANQVIEGEVKYRNVLHKKTYLKDVVFESERTKHNVESVLMIAVTLLLLVLVMSTLGAFADFIREHLWKATYSGKYEAAVSDFIDRGKLSESVSPAKLPKELWDELKDDVPQAPKSEGNNIFLPIFLLVFSILVALAGMWIVSEELFAYPF